MINHRKQQLYYKALLEKNPKYDGIFYVGVKTTGVFCMANQAAMAAGFLVKLGY